MGRLTTIAIGLISLLISCVSNAQSRVILDADIDSDVDDVSALAMLHTLADEKKVEMLGVIVTSDDPFAVTCADAINYHFKRPDLPVGFLRNQTKLNNHSRYTRQISMEFPHRLKSHNDARDAIDLYRELLITSPDSSVVIITIGHLTSLQRLLQSGPDQYSPLTGMELVEKKVKRWICMGGVFPEGKEANFYRPDPNSTVYCLEMWKKPVTFVGWELGEKVKTGDQYLKNKIANPNPVYRAYELYNNFAGRSSWDQLAVYLLDEESALYFETVTDGYCKVYEDGSNKWYTNTDSLHEYARFKPSVDYRELAKKIDDLATGTR